MNVLGKYVENRTDFLLPKGENYSLVTETMAAAGYSVPEFEERCLHPGCRRQNI